MRPIHEVWRAVSGSHGRMEGSCRHPSGGSCARVMLATLLVKHAFLIAVTSILIHFYPSIFKSIVLCFMMLKLNVSSKNHFGFYSIITFVLSMVVELNFVFVKSNWSNTISFKKNSYIPYEIALFSVIIQRIKKRISNFWELSLY